VQAAGGAEPGRLPACDRTGKRPKTPGGALGGGVQVLDNGGSPLSNKRVQHLLEAENSRLEPKS